MTRLPLLLSVPHAGLEVPPWLAGGCALSSEEIAQDGDEGAAEIYLLLESSVAALVTTPVARAVLDMNRPEHDRTTDGVVKTHTCWDVPVWRAPLTPAEIERLFAEHHRPYHRALSAAADRPDVRLGVDAHTMAATAPPEAPDPGAIRPAACLSNADGTCPREWLEVLAEPLAARLGEVRINDPFRGGHITRSHASEMPWLQVELSRDPVHSPDTKRAAVFAALEALVALLGARS